MLSTCFHDEKTYNSWIIHSLWFFVYQFLCVPILYVSFLRMILYFKLASLFSWPWNFASFNLTCVTCLSNLLCTDLCWPCYFESYITIIYCALHNNALCSSCRSNKKLKGWFCHMQWIASCVDRQGLTLKTSVCNIIIKFSVHYVWFKTENN